MNAGSIVDTAARRTRGFLPRPGADHDLLPSEDENGMELPADGISNGAGRQQWW